MCTVDVNGPIALLCHRNARMWEGRYRSSFLRVTFEDASRRVNDMTSIEHEEAASTLAVTS